MKNILQKHSPSDVKTGIAILIILAGLVSLLLLAGCSHASQMASAEGHQAAALYQSHQAVQSEHAAQKAKDGQIANLTQGVRILLSMPATPATVVAADKLLDASLTLTGAPTDNEARLESEVQELLATQERADAQMAQINKKNAELVAALNDSRAKEDIANAKVATTTTKLYAMSNQAASAWDSLNALKWYFITAVVLLMVIYGIHLAIVWGKTGAIVASKVPL